jgi:putative ATPase
MVRNATSYCIHCAQRKTSPACSREVFEKDINLHLDNNCVDSAATKQKATNLPKSISKQKTALAPIFTGTSLSSKKDSVATNSRVVSLIATKQKRRANDIDSTHELAGPSSKKSKASNAATSRISSAAPLAERLRPQSLDEFVGQPHLTAHDSLLMGLVRTGSTGSMLFWGPPGYSVYCFYSCSTSEHLFPSF